MTSGTIEVVETLPHAADAYTQGLVFHDGVLYESTGRYGSSELRRVDPASGEVRTRVELADEHFGEGLARVGDTLVQLTWKEGVALRYDLRTLQLVDSVAFDTHGWGLCYDGEHLFSTSGGSIVFRRDPVTLETIDFFEVLADDGPVHRLNELECVDGYVYANVFQSNEIVRFETATGRVTARFDASALVPGELRGNRELVLNGIAHDAGSGTFYLTGKSWPVSYRVRLRTP